MTDVLSSPIGSARRLAPRLLAALAAFVLLVALPDRAGAQLADNSRVARILGMLDINGRGGADAAEDTDNNGVPDGFLDIDLDGLPDQWELGGLDPQSTDVPFPAPEAIVPGTPPTPLFNRRPVRTDATVADSDGDGLSDFIEVFGLKFIDDNNNGVLEDACVRDATGCLFNSDGTPQRATDANGNPIGEWFDFNNDGMPSIGEYPATNILVAGSTVNFDFDGFVFTDPTNADTDADGEVDGVDNNPLVNALAFGTAVEIGSVDTDFDNDGLGDAMDFGRDVDAVINNPADLDRVLSLFRPDLLRVQPVVVSEGLIEDLLVVDWNGDGLFRSVEVKQPHFGIPVTPLNSAGAIKLFEIQDPDHLDNANLKIPLGVNAGPQHLFPDAVREGGPPPHVRTTYYSFARRGAGGTNLPLPYQELLTPVSRNENVFMPDPRIWTVLYSWRMPGFDIDGNGFIGVDGLSFAGSAVLNGTPVGLERGANLADPSSEFPIPGTGFQLEGLDGIVEANCGQGICLGAALTIVSLAFAGTWLARRR